MAGTFTASPVRGLRAVRRALFGRKYTETGDRNCRLFQGRDDSVYYGVNGFSAPALVPPIAVCTTSIIACLFILCVTYYY